MSEHTATPWLSKLRDSEVAIYGPGNIQVVATSWHSSIRSSYPLKQESLANAAFIVKAVNSHDALVKALQKLDSFLDFGDEKLETVWTFDSVDGIQEAFSQAREALASIKEAE